VDAVLDEAMARELWVIRVVVRRRVNLRDRTPKAPLQFTDGEALRYYADDGLSLSEIDARVREQYEQSGHWLRRRIGPRHQAETSREPWLVSPWSDLEIGAILFLLWWAVMGPIAITYFAALAVGCAGRARAVRARLRRHECIACGYEISAGDRIAQRCSECGTTTLTVPA